MKNFQLWILPISGRIFLFAIWIIASCQRETVPIHRQLDELPAVCLNKEILIKEGLIKPGQTLEEILLNAGIRRRSGHQIIKQFETMFDPKQLHPGQRYKIWGDSCGAIQRFEFIPDLQEKVWIAKNSSGTYTASCTTTKLVKRIQTVRGTISNTLYEAILKLGEGPELIVAFSDIFQWDIDFFTDPRIGDEFRIIYEAYHLPAADSATSVGRFVKYGRILAAQYTMQDHPLIAIYFDNDPQDAGYYSPDGKSFQKTFLKSPLNYRRISSYFSGTRRHPITKKIRPHYAVDYAAPEGTPVVASADGVIIEMGYNRGLGNFIKIRHNDPHFLTLYGHLRGFAKGIREKISVQQAKVIGYVGATGLATGPHLHYAFYLNGKPINPLRIKNTSADPILRKNINGFDKVRTEMIWELLAIDGAARSRLSSLWVSNKIGTRWVNLPAP